MNKTIFASLVALMCVMSGTTLATAATAPVTSPVSYGTTSAAVTRLQQFLVEQNFLTVAPTGYYGLMTAAAVEKFQIAMGISPTYSRRVGPLTLSAIADVAAGRKSTGGGSGTTLPAVRTRAANDVTSSTALLAGNILASGVASSLSPSFVYGTTLSYGSSAQASLADGVAVARLTGLTCGTTYHYAFVLKNSALGSSTGGDATFTTAQCGA